MSGKHWELSLADLDLGDVPISACSWHAAVGDRVVEGDRLIELVCGEVTVDLPSPASGVLIRRCVEVDQVLRIGQLLAIVEAS